MSIIVEPDSSPRLAVPNLPRSLRQQAPSVTETTRSSTIGLRQARSPPWQPPLAAPRIAKRGLVLSRGREDFSTQSRICLGSRARTGQIANHKRRRGGVGTLLLRRVWDCSCKIFVSRRGGFRGSRWSCRPLCPGIPLGSGWSRRPLCPVSPLGSGWSRRSRWSRRAWITLWARRARRTGLVKHHDPLAKNVIGHDLSLNTSEKSKSGPIGGGLESEWKH